MPSYLDLSEHERQVWQAAVKNSTDVPFHVLVEIRCAAPASKGTCAGFLGMVCLVPDRGPVLAVRTGDHLPAAVHKRVRDETGSRAHSETVVGAHLQYLDEDQEELAEPALCERHGHVPLSLGAVLDKVQARMRPQRPGAPKASKVLRVPPPA